jgi:hypothetical protein
MLDISEAVKSILIEVVLKSRKSLGVLRHRREREINRHFYFWKNVRSIVFISKSKFQCSI